MHPIMKTGRALQLDEISNSQNKVTLGFKCSALLKIELANEAARVGMSLSEYVETITQNRNLNLGNSSSSPHSNEINNLNQHLKEIQRKLSFFYDEPMMKSAFQRYKGQIIPYTDKDGIFRKDAVIAIEDIYKILFKTNKLY